MANINFNYDFDPHVNDAWSLFSLGVAQSIALIKILLRVVERIQPWKLAKKSSLAKVATI